MKKRDYLLFLFVIINIIITSIFIYTTPKKTDPYVRIQIDHKIYGQYPLNENRVIPINDTNTCIIDNGKVYMKEANCPDQLCIHFKPIDYKGGTIVCLPNKIVLEIINDNQEIDTIT